MKRIISLLAVFVLIAQSFFMVNAAETSKLLVSGSADWLVVQNCATVLKNSRMIASELFKNFGVVGQQHIMTNQPSDMQCAVMSKVSSADFVDAFKIGSKLEMLCYVAEESETDEVTVELGNFAASGKVEKGKISKLVIPLSSFMHGSYPLTSAASDFDGNYITVGMTAKTGRLDLVFSDIYISDGNHFSGSFDYDDVNSQRPSGMFVNFGKRTDVEYDQSGNTVPTVENSNEMKPLSALKFSVKGEAAWTSDITLVKYFSTEMFNECKGLNFYIRSSGSSSDKQNMTVRLRSLAKNGSDYTQYVFSRDIFFLPGSYRLISIDLADMFSNEDGKTLSGDILKGVYALELEFAKHDGKDGKAFDFVYEISDIYGYTESRSYIPKITASASAGKTEMPTMTDEISSVMEVADLYSRLPGAQPDLYTYADYQTLKSFLDKYSALSDADKKKLSDNYGVTQAKYDALFEMYQNMDEPAKGDGFQVITQRAAENTDSVHAENNVSEKTFFYLFISVTTAAAILMIIAEKGKKTADNSTEQSK